jgi:hypothetical protein
MPRRQPDNALAAQLAAKLGAPREFSGYDTDQARLFAAAWLPAWTGNDPQQLASYYTHDTFYSDPQVPNGIRGRNALTEYLTRLLARYPNWTWVQTGSAPMRGGFINHWGATIPVAGADLRVSGICLVVLRAGLIARNEVFFDRTVLMGAIRVTADPR